MEMFMSFFKLMPSKFVLISVFFLLLHVILCKVCRAPKLSEHGPPAYPIIGCLISFYKNRSRLLDWYTELVEESNTNTIVVNRLGGRRTIVTANLENVEYMLKTNFNNFPKGKPFTEILGDFLGYGIFNVDGELWRTQRKLASHAFSTNCLRELVMSTLEEEVENQFLPFLESLAEASAVVDLQELLRRLAFSIICKVSLGVDLCAPLRLSKAFDMASEICAKRGAAPLLLVWKVKRWVGVGSEKKLRDAIEEVHAYVEEMIHEKKERMEVSPYKFPVFQAGPRICIGKDMAFIQMKYVVASVLRHFEIKLVGSERPVFVPLLTAHMATGVKVVIQKRQ